MRCHVIHGDNADLLTGFISVEASVCSCAHSCVNGISMLMCSGKHWYECDLYCACGCPASRVVRPSIDIVLTTELNIVLSGFQWAHVLWWTLQLLFDVYECDLSVPVVVLVLWLPGHLQTQCWSPNWLMFCQGFSIHVYPGRHCGSCFICMSVIFIVPVDVLPYGCQAICRHSADHPNEQCFD